MSRARRALAGARIAVGLLTVIPVAARSEAGGLRSSAPWFPLVGAGVGLAAGAVEWAAYAGLGAGVAAVLALVTLVVLTGALHEDGLADCADAVGVRGGRERRLEVMGDSTVGAFGVLALVLWGLLFAATLAALPRHDAIRTLVLACALGRWAAVLHAATTPPARRAGLGASFATGGAGLAVATLVAVVAVAVAVAAAGLQVAAGLAAFGGAVAVVAAVGYCAGRGVGGRTGDTLGATVALTEIVVCLVLLGFAR